MDSNTASPVPEGGRDLDETPSDVRQALQEVHAAVEILNRDQQVAIRELAFERAAELRERAETLKRRKEEIIREWQQAKSAKPAEPPAQPNRPRD